MQPVDLRPEPEQLQRFGLAARDLAADAGTAVYLDDGAREALARDIRETGVAEVLVLSTCDRLDLYMLGGDLPSAPCQPAPAALIRSVAARTGLPPAQVARHGTSLTGRAALEALFATAASLSSETVGDPNVLGQMKAAHREALAAGQIGAALDGLLQAAYAAAKRILSGTAVGRLPVSLASVAGAVARDIFGSIADCRVMLLGAGDMGQILARHFAGQGVGRFTCTDRDAAQSAALATRFDAHVEPFEAIEAALERTDIVIAATEDRRLVADAALMQRVLKRRRRRPIFIVDVAVPEDFDPAVERVNGVFRYDLGDLEKVALDNRAAREISATEARALVTQELDAYLAAGGERRAVPAINDLRARFESERRAVLKTVSGAGAEEATRLLVNRLLHRPVRELRALAREDRLEESEAVLRVLFGLTGEPAEDDQAAASGKRSK